VAQFGHDLRRLRQDAGAPSYRELAIRARYSTTVLSRAANGRDLPSLPVVMAYVTACGGDAAHWERRWRELAAARRPVPVTVPLADTPAVPAPVPVHAGRRLGTALLVGAAAVTGLVLPGMETDPLDRPLVVRDGVDPDVAGCGKDAVSMATTDVRLVQPIKLVGRTFDRGEVIGTVEARYSARCRAAWARMTPRISADGPVASEATVGVSRPTDHAAVSLRLGHIETMHSDLLRVDTGCVTAYAIFLFADGNASDAQTPCRQAP